MDSEEWSKPLFDSVTDEVEDQEEKIGDKIQSTNNKEKHFLQLKKV